MRWKVGFFRAWIVISAVWVLVVAGVNYSRLIEFREPLTGPWSAYQNQAVERLGLDWTTLNVEGHRVKVDGSFRQLTPQEQEATVEEIARSLGLQSPPTDEELERLGRALRGAHEAGDTDAARTIAAEINRQRAMIEPVTGELFFVRLPDGTIVEFPEDTPLEVMQQAIRRYYAQQNALASARARRWRSETLQAAAIGFAPPLGLLLLGATIGWVASGFRAKNG